MIGGIEQMFTGATLLAALAYIGYQLKSIPSFIWDLVKKQFVFTIHLEDSSDVYYCFERWLWDYHNHLFKNVKVQMEDEIKGYKGNVDDHDNDRKIRIIHFDDTFFLKYKGKRLLIHKSREKMEHAADPSNLHFNSFSISGWFAKSQMLELINEIVLHNDKYKSSTQSIFMNTSYGDWNNIGVLKGKNIDNIVLTGKDEIINDITDFKTKEKWYRDRNLPYKRGYMFAGKPGNGKTSLAIAIALHFKNDIYFLNLNDLEKDSSLVYTFSQIKPKSILVIEDADVSSGNRKNKKSVSLSSILNCMDGAFSKHGLITIITTNHPEKLDPAMIRSGRIDVKIDFENPNLTAVQNYLRMFYNNHDFSLKSYHKNYSMADIQELCVRNKDLNNAAKELQQ